MKKYIWTITGIAILILCAVFLPGLLFKKTLTGELANALGTKEEVLNLNLPPSPQRLPGTIIGLHKDRFVTYGGPFRDDERIVEGTEFSVSGILSDSKVFSGSLSSSVLKEAVENQEDLDIAINITGGRILEMNVPDLKELIAQHDYAKDKRNQRENQMVIHKAYEGIIEYTIADRDTKSGELFVNLNGKAQRMASRNDSVKYSAKADSDRSFKLTVNQPTIIAYESLSVQDVANSLSGVDAEVTLQEITVEQILGAASKSRDRSIESPHSSKRIGVITIASGHFDNLATMDIPEVVSSAQKVNEILADYAPVYEKHLHSTADKPLTDDGILDWSIDRTLELMAEDLDFLVIYYAGHGFQRGDGELLLPQGNLKKDFAEAALRSVEYPEEDDGYITVQTLYDAFGTTDTPYVVIVDACFPSEEIQGALDRVYMTLSSPTDANLLYNGPNALITDEMSEISRTLRQIGQRFDYRTDENPIIFSAKPGVLAPLVPDPYDITGERMAPLARDLYTRYEASFPAYNRSLAELIESVIYSKGYLGEITLNGSISWSDLSQMRDSLGDVYVKID